MGNEVEERKHWEEVDKKLCRLRGGGVGNMGAHIEKV